MPFEKGNRLGVRHGHAFRGKTTPTYNSWQRMMSRCYQTRNMNYHFYGGRGITVCKRWHKFENFLADMGERPAGLTLDRKNNDRGYSKRNCRWITQADQLKNRRRYGHANK